MHLETSASFLLRPSKMKVAVYTCIVGGYDDLRQLKVTDKDFDYICFVDRKVGEGERDGVWTLRTIPYDNPNPTRESRYVKILPHIALPEYDYTIWIDANLDITGEEFYSFVKAAIAKGCLYAGVPHFARDCVYDDIITCYRDDRISFRDARRQYKYLEDIGFPKHYGLLENNVILRKSLDPKIIGIDRQWWNDFDSGVPRDQFSLMPVLWESSIQPNLLFGEGCNSRNVPFMEYSLHPWQRGTHSLHGLPLLKQKSVWTWRKLVTSQPLSFILWK